MGNWRKRFPSTYLKASDLDEGPIDATIKGIVNETIGQGEKADLKPVLHFREKPIKPVVMNMTRMEAVEQIAGTPDDEQWAGVRVRLQKGRTQYKGERVDCVDIVAPPKARTASTVTPANRPPKRKAPTAAEPEPDDPLPTDVDDEEAPF
jgi:hypothetical protein